MNANLARTGALCAASILGATGAAGAQSAPAAGASAAPNASASAPAGASSGSMGSGSMGSGSMGSGGAGAGTGTGGGTSGGSMGSGAGAMGAGTGAAGSMGGMKAGAGAMNSMTTPMSDATFPVKAAQGGMTEVKAAQIALKNSSNPTVRAYATRMIAEHTKNNAQLAAIVKSTGGTMLPKSVDATQQAELSKLAALHGTAFDQQYVSGQIADHAKTLALMQAEAANGKQPKYVSFAKMTTPVVKMHLATAQADSAKMMHAKSSM